MNAVLLRVIVRLKSNTAAAVYSADTCPRQIFFVFCRYGVVESVADQRDSIEYQKQRRAEKKKEASKNDK